MREHCIQDMPYIHCASGGLDALDGQSDWQLAVEQPRQLVHWPLYGSRATMQVERGLLNAAQFHCRLARPSDTKRQSQSHTPSARLSCPFVC